MRRREEEDGERECEMMKSDPADRERRSSEEMRGGGGETESDLGEEEKRGG